MTKSEAIKLLGGTVSAAASRIGISPQAVTGWPHTLTAAIADRVQAAIAREHMAPEKLGIAPEVAASLTQGCATLADRRDGERREENRHDASERRITNSRAAQEAA